MEEIGELHLNSQICQIRNSSRLNRNLSHTSVTFLQPLILLSSDYRQDGDA